MGVDVDGFTATVRDFNEGAQGNVVDFARLDAASSATMALPKTNWAQPLDEPPFVGYPVACGITFTYGGVRTDRTARVLDGRGRPVDGLFAVGEIQGGLFRERYAGGSGLMRGAVFGRLAGTVAAESPRA
jgi:tricarballylate dehydrogenase